MLVLKSKTNKTFVISKHKKYKKTFMLMTFLKKDHRGLALPDFKAYLKAHNNYKFIIKERQIDKDRNTSKTHSQIRT